MWMTTQSSFTHFYYLTPLWVYRSWSLWLGGRVLGLQERGLLCSSTEASAMSKGPPFPAGMAFSRLTSKGGDFHPMWTARLSTEKDLSSQGMEPHYKEITADTLKSSERWKQKQQHHLPKFPKYREGNLGVRGGCVLQTGSLIKADKTLKREEEPLKVQDRKIEKRTDFLVLFCFCLKTARKKAWGRRGYSHRRGSIFHLKD